MTLPGIFDRARFPRAALATAILAATASLGRAGPTGGDVVAGDGSVSRPDANTTNVQQNSDKLVVEWGSFDVNVGESVNFYQPSSTALVLNQILNGDVSVIRGQINANGQVILANPNGVYFGDSAQLSVGSLVASGHAIDTADFLNGELNFEHQEGTDGSVINHGTIEAASGGSVTLLGRRVENHGYIVAHAGRINLAVGDRIALDFDGDGLMRFSIDEAVLENLSGADSALTNTGELLANGGTIVLEGQVAQDIFSQVVNNDGIIRAGRIDNTGGVISLVGSGGRDNSVVNSGQIDASAMDANSDGGKITLHAEDSTLLVQDGSQISASSNNQQGGQVHLLGDQIALTGDASVDASGELGGGEILVGGDYQGKSTGVPNADKVIVGSGVLLNADAHRLGDGGRIIVWADDWTRFAGTLTARGGSEGGDGGFAEVSGKQKLAYNGFADLSAMVGEFGVLLLDPETIQIVSGVGDEDDELNGDNVVDFTDDDAGDQSFVISASAINSQSSSVVLQATQDITQDSDAAISMDNVGVGITLQAGQNIDLQAGITTQGGAIVLEADSSSQPGGSNGTGTLTIAGSGLTTNGGGQAGADVTLSGNVVDVDSAIAAGNGAVAMSGAGDILLGANVTTTGTQTYNHDVTLSGERTLGGSTVNFAGTLTGDGSDLTINGNLDLDDEGSGIGELEVNGDLDLNALANLSSLTRLNVTGASSLGADVSTAGTQTYGGAVTLTDAVTLTAIDSAITFNSTIGGAHHLAVNAGDDTVSFGNGGDDDDVNVGSLEVTATTINLFDDITTTTASTGSQIYTGDVTLNTGVQLATNNSDITFNGSVDGAFSLTLTAGTGTVTFGDGTDSDAVTIGSLTATAGTIKFNDNVTTSAGGQTYNGALQLGANTTLDSGDSNVDFNGDLDAAGNNLTVNVDGGDFSYQALNNLNDLAITETNLTLSQDITTAGTQTYNGSVMLEGDRTLAGSSVNFASSVSGNDADGDDSLAITGNLDLDGALTEITSLSVSGDANLAADVTTSGTQTYSGAVTLNGDRILTTNTDVHFVNTVSGDGGDNDSLDIDGNLDLDGAASGLTALDVSGTSNLAADVTTTGKQTYSGAVTLNGDRILTAGTDVQFVSAVSGDGGDNDSLDIDGNLDLDGAASGLTALDVSGTANLAADVTTTGKQTYTGAVTLSGDRILTAGTDVQFVSTVSGDGGDNDSLDIDGNLDLDGAASGLTALDISGTSNLAADVTTTGKQAYGGAVTLNGDRILTAGTDVQFVSTVSGDGGDNDSLDIDGNLDLDGAASGLTALDVSGTSNLAADVTTTGKQTYSGAVTLNGDRILTAGTDVQFVSTVSGDGGDNDSLDITGNLDLDGAASGLTALDVSGTANLAADVTTTGKQTYSGAVTLNGDRILTAGTDVQFVSAVSGDGGDNDSLDITGNLDLDGAASGLTALDVSGTANLAANVTTTGKQTYSGAVTLSGDRILTAGTDVQFVSAVSGDGGDNDSLDIAGNIDLDGAASGLTALDVSGTANLAANVTTTGKQTYSGAVTLSGDRILTAGTDVQFVSTVSGDGGDNDSLDVAGNLDLDGAASDLTALDVSGTSNLAADVTTTGKQTYSGAVTLNGDRILTAGTDVQFVSAVSGDGGDNDSLDIIGNLDLDGAASGLTALDVSGTSNLAADVTTSGAQTYTGTATMEGDRVLAGSLVTFSDTLTSNNNDLDITGNLALNGATSDFADLRVTGNLDLNADITNSGSLRVDGTADLAADVSTTGGQTYSGAVDLNGERTLTASLVTFTTSLTGDSTNNLIVNGDLSLGSGGTSNIGLLDVNGNLTSLTGAITNTDSIDVSGTANLAANISTNRTQNYQGNVTLASGVDLDADDDNISFGGTINGSHDLTVNAGTADVTFANAIGNTTALDDLTVTGSDIALNGNVTTNGVQTYNGASTITGSRTLDGTTVSFNGTLAGNGNNLNVLHNLTLGGATSNFGDLDVGGNLDLDGAITNTDSLDVTGTSNLAADVTTSGTQTYTGAVDLVGVRTLNGTAIAFGSTLTGDNNAFNVDGNLTLGDDATALGAVDVDGNLDAQGEINSASLDVSGTSSLAGNVTTTGLQTYTGIVTLAGNVDLNSTGNDITFSNNLVGAGFNLGIDVDGGDFSYQSLSGLNDFTLTETNIQLSQDITTTGSQTYTGNVTLMNDIRLDTTNDAITFNGSVDGNGDGTESLTLDIENATATFTGNVGTTNQLEFLDVEGETQLGGDVTTLNQQNYQQAVTLTGDATLSTSNTSHITFGSSIDGAGALVLNAGAGAINFGGNLGSGTALTTLAVNADEFDLNHDVTTTGGQDYNGIVTLTDDVTLTANGAVDFSDTVDGDHSLIIDAGTGPVSFGSTVGVDENLAALNVTANAINLNANVETTGNQDYTGAVILFNDISLTATNADITVDGTVDGDSSGAQSLTLNSGNGNLEFTGAIGGGTALNNLTITDANDSQFDAINLANTFTQHNGDGTTTLGGAIDAHSIDFTVSGLTLLSGISLDTSANGSGDITLNVDDLLTVGGSTTINAGSGQVSLAPSTDTNTVQICRGGACDTGAYQTVYDLNDLSITADAIQFGSNDHTADITLEGIVFDYELLVINDGDINITGNLDGSNGGALIINPGASGDAIFEGGEVHTEFDQTYSSNVELTGDFQLTSDSGDINFTGSVTGSDSLTITHASDVNLGGTVNLGGDFDLQDADGTLTLVDGLSLTAANIVLNAATITSGGGATITLSTTANGDIDLITDDLSLGGDLELDAGTGTITLAPQDSTASLELCSDASCPGAASGGALYNIGAGFSFNSAANFQVGQDNHSGDIILYGFTANYDLALANTGTGSITIEGDFTSNHDLSLTSGSGGISLGATIDTGAGTQTYDGAVTLADNTTLATDDADVSFTSTVDGTHDLTITTGDGDVTFDGAVGGGTALASLDVDAGDITFTDIDTNNALSLHAQNTLGFTAGTTLTAGDPLTLAINQAGGSAVTLDLNGLTLDSTNIQLLGSGADRLQGYDTAANSWAVTGTDSGTLDSTDLSSTASFDGFSELGGGDVGDTFNISGSYAGNLVGGDGDDTFNRLGTGAVNGQINGGAGTNTYDVSGTSSAVTLVFGQGFSNIQSLIGDGDLLRGSVSGSTTWTLNGDDSGTLGVGGDTFTFDGFDTLISGAGGTNTFTSDGQYAGDIDLRGNDNRWHYTAGQTLTQGQVLGSGALSIPHRDDLSAGDMSVSGADLSLPDLINYTGNLFIGALITPGTLPLNANYNNLDINANRLTISDAIQTGGNLILMASEIILTGASINTGKGVSFVAVGNDCAVCGGLTGSGNVIVNAETLVEAQSGQIIAAGGVSQSDNLILDFNGGSFELAVSEEQQLTSEPSSLSDAEGVPLTTNTSAFINRLGLDLVSVSVNFSNPAAAVLGVRAIEVIDLALFEEDLTLFGRMGEGVALAFAQCEEIEGCTPDVTAEELTASIDDLQERIDRLEGELTTTSDAQRREQIQTLLAGFRAQQSEFSTYKADLQSFTGFEELMDEELGTDQEIDMEAVERQLAVIETIYTRVRFLENLQFNADRRAQFAEATGLDLTEQRLNEIIESTLAVASRAESELETLLD
ncbi:hypothetical protein BGP77_16680 [Saccharospirillum sp. MSK14-1]|uniref:two-partner secretion domain-containing protein n=1 Tax=Saccharospirillum sp. MSK14-1 TaxID=1897632 RepID=UPI000D3FBB27|nr:filamentous hemagglutinin N-terminal domain-containing protein [Saccharospirillum sp. MSK14-1]PTY38086.1 hypothetical protein BGP77_16680 [Saccharospirillum sp. MSK14-1]